MQHVEGIVLEVTPVIIDQGVSGRCFDGHEESFTLASQNVTIRVSEIYRRLSIPIEKRTFMPLEIIEPADEQEDS